MNYIDPICNQPILPADLARDLSLLRELEARLAQTRYEAALRTVRQRIALLEGGKSERHQALL